MTAMGWAAFATLAAWTLFSFVLFAKSGQSIRHAENRVADLKALKEEEAERDSQIIAELRYRAEHAEVALSDLETRLKHLGEALGKAVHRGEKAAAFLATQWDKERSTAVARITTERREWATERAHWTMLLLTALRLAQSSRRALPSAARKPKALPRGGYIVEPDLILPADDEDAGFTYWASEPEPAKVNGTGGR